MVLRYRQVNILLNMLAEEEGELAKILHTLMSKRLVNLEMFGLISHFIWYTNHSYWLICLLVVGGHEIIMEDLLPLQVIFRLPLVALVA